MTETDDRAPADEAVTGEVATGEVATGEVVEVRAAGGILARARQGTGTALGATNRSEDEEVEILLVHRPRYDDWSFPKGKAQRAESDEATALREVFEETGIVAELRDELDPVRYRDSKGRYKEVRYWLMRVVEDHGLAPNDEVDALRWLSPAAAARLATYPHDRRLIAEIWPPRGSP